MKTVLSIDQPDNNPSDAPPARASTPANRLGLSWPLIVTAVAFLATIRCSSLLNDPDTFWHLAAGQWMLEHWAIPTTDPFSSTMRGSPWTAHEWLSEVVLAAAHGFGGWQAVLALTAFAFAATLGICTRYLLRHLEPAYALLFVAVGGALVAGHLLARPHALTLPILAYWAVSLLNAREEDHAPSCWLGLAMVLWANLHGGFAVGIGLVGAFMFEALLSAGDGAQRWRVGRAWGRFLAVSVIASLLTPHGVQGWGFVAQLHQMSFALDVIAEWRSPDFHQFQPLELGLMIVAAAVLTRGLRLPVVRLALVLAVLHLALKHVRHADLAGILIPLIMARSCAEQWRAPNRENGVAALDRAFESLIPPARPLAVIVTAAVLLSAAMLQQDDIEINESSAPEAALQAAHKAALSGRVLNSYEFGGYLIMNGIPPFIDGRADMYGDRFMRSYYGALNLTQAGALEALLERYKVAWTLLAPPTPAISLLDHLSGWERVYADDRAVIHVRKSE